MCIRFIFNINILIIFNKLNILDFLQLIGIHFKYWVSFNLLDFFSYIRYLHNIAYRIKKIYITTYMTFLKCFENKIKKTA